MNYQNSLTVRYESLLSDLKSLDFHGWCCLTDGSIDHHSLVERIQMVREAIEWIKNENENIDDDYRQNFRKA
jgi:hypothetical protein